ncbi:MAG: FAD-dependent oxidoreductase [Pirellulaceae bacterium]
MVWISKTTLLAAACIVLLPGCQSDTGNRPAPAADVNAAGQEHDVIVVGAGISGLTTALELSRGGIDVTIVDMSTVYGGHAVMSEGGISIVDSPLQRELGMEDSPDLAYQDFIEWGEGANEPWVRRYVDRSKHDIHDWLVKLGIRFESVETAPGNSVDRFHQPAGRGIGLVTPIYHACLAQENIDFQWNSQVTRLLIEDERVVGVETLQLRTGRRRQLKAAQVVLATGGFQSNLDMVREYWPAEFPFPEKILAGSGRNSVGHGHRLATAAGADLVNMDYQWNYFTGIPDPRAPDSQHGLSAANMWGIIVNPQGKRFANLHNWAKEVMPRLLQQEKATLWFIFDESTRKEFVVSGSEWSDFDKVDRLILQNRRLVKKADTLEQLAVQSGLPADQLVATVARYNQLVGTGRDEDFDRFGPDRSDYNNEASPPLRTPPYYAMQAYPLTRKSMGGVSIDLACRVLDKKKQPIPGLFAVGELTGLAGINGKAALEGTFLGPCVLTGRVAAQAIIGEDPRPSGPPPRPLEGSPRHIEGLDSDGCWKCHDIHASLGSQRDGYWHFEHSHRIVLERDLDCLECHAELAPYQESRHLMNPRMLTFSCVFCHVAQEIKKP